MQTNKFWLIAEQDFFLVSLTQHIFFIDIFCVKVWHFFYKTMHAKTCQNVQLYVCLNSTINFYITQIVKWFFHIFFSIINFDPTDWQKKQLQKPQSFGKTFFYTFSKSCWWATAHRWGFGGEQTWIEIILY